MNKSSPFYRILSGSAASWCGIAVNFSTQLILVPILIRKLGADGFGIWILVNAVFNLIKIPELSHQDFVGREILRLEKEEDRQKIFLGSLFCGLFFCACFMGFSFAAYLASMNSGAFGQGLEFWISLTVILFSWGLTGTFFGLLHRRLAVYGYWPRFAWLGVILRLIELAAIILAVIGPPSVVRIFVFMAIGRFLYIGACIPYALYLLHTHSIMPKLSMQYLRLGVKNLKKSQVLGVITGFNELRTQGLRIFLAFHIGSAALGAFAAMRTGANVVVQGLGTIMTPMMPELMRYLRTRDEGKSVAALFSIWLITVGVLCGSIIVVNPFIGTLFDIWTGGKIEFDPVLFSFLAISVLVFGAAQPCAAVTQGNNLLGSQLKIAIWSSASLLAGLFCFVPHYSLRGVGLALVISELVALLLFSMTASKWFSKNGMKWPWAGLGLTLFAIGLTGVVLLLSSTNIISVFPVSLGTVLMLIIIIRILWKQTPLLARERFRRIFVIS